MPNPKDWTGIKIGRLTPIKYLYSEEVGTQGKSKRMWLCECDCGNHKIVSSGDLSRGNVKSCGCLLKEVFKSNSANPKQTTHGQSNTRLYKCWSKMKRRCSAEPNWIKKGIKVCEEWNRFEPFMEWSIQNGYADNLTLDRIDPLGDYEPLNCRWATYHEQANNKTTNRIITIFGVSKTLTEWGRIANIKPATLSKRIEHGYPMDLWLVPVGDKYFTDYNERKSYLRKITINGETKSLTEWSKATGLRPATIATRIDKSWPESDWLAPPGTVYHGSRSDNLRGKRRFHGKNCDIHKTDNDIRDFYTSAESEREVDIMRFDNNAFKAQCAYRTGAKRVGASVLVKRRNGRVFLTRRELNKAAI